MLSKNKKEVSLLFFYRGYYFIIVTVFFHYRGCFFSLSSVLLGGMLIGVQNYNISNQQFDNVFDIRRK